jgi:hypothetical protein
MLFFRYEYAAIREALDNTKAAAFGDEIKKIITDGVMLDKNFFCAGG